MAGYQPLYVRGNQTGLVQNRQQFILPDDAYPILENAFVWREQLKRRQGLKFLGRLQREIAVTSISLTSGSVNLITALSLEDTASITPGSISLIGSIDGTTYTDPSSDGILIATGGTGTGGTINYATGLLSINSGASETVTGTIDYFPGLPCMGVRTQEQNSSVTEGTIFFDTVYAYYYTGTEFQELVSSTPTTWTGQDYNFFWSTNYWVDGSTPPNKLFWATNYSGATGDPMRYYNSITWTDFTPTIDASSNVVAQCLCMLPFRGRLVLFNTLEGSSLSASKTYYQRIRWSAIGNPIPSGPYQPWLDDVRGQGGFLDIPTSENIVSVGFVRDNLVIYCDRSTWQLRYTGRSIAPFQIEKVNSELGAYSTFSAVQFDTSLVGIGDKGVVECDSYKSQRIDIKIPDLVFNFSNENNGPARVQGIRDIQQRLAYWTYVSSDVEADEQAEGGTGIYPDRRLVYNYENDSWAIFTDSLTALGTLWITSSITWDEADLTWNEANYPWNSVNTSFPSIVGGNQQGFVMYLGGNLQPKVNNDNSLFISTITGNTTTATQITSPNHNLVSGQVVQLLNISSNDPFYSLNGLIFGIIVTDANNFLLYTYVTSTQQFSNPQLNSPAIYIGGATIAVRDGFNITSKKFNFLDQGQNIQLGYIDLLMSSTDSGAITLNAYINYADNPNQAVNTLPENNQSFGTPVPDDFFNQIIPTSQTQLGGFTGSKYSQRVNIPCRGAFITLQYTLSNAQLIGVEQESEVQIDSQILWMRPAGRLQTF